MSAASSINASSEKCARSSAYSASLTSTGAPDITSASVISARSGAVKASSRSLTRFAISSSLSPYILPPAELMSIQKGQPTPGGGAQLRDRSVPPRHPGLLAEQHLRDDADPEHARHARLDLVRRQILAEDLADAAEHLPHEKRGLGRLEAGDAGHHSLVPQTEPIMLWRESPYPRARSAPPTYFAAASDDPSGCSASRDRPA